MNRNLKNEEVKKYITIGASADYSILGITEFTADFFSDVKDSDTVYAFFNRRGHCIYYECANEAD